jgi:hypothetical protein
MAMAVIGGLVVSTPLSLLVVPAFYVGRAARAGSTPAADPDAGQSARSHRPLSALAESELGAHDAAFTR